MAMLAGPRQRKRYNLVPKGKALFEDSDRFGTKMLEKMGWSKGKGLGSKENGQQEFIRIRYKNDPNGLGYEDRDDQWTEHEKHFNGLLESLHAGDSNSNTASGDDGDELTPRVGFGFESSKTSKEKLKDKFSGQSLEERSKKSKARVHYKKFTKGKDMAQYSEKDLANIFGKKATAEENDFYNQLPSFNAGSEASDDGEKPPAFELGTHTINTGLSVSDYFKMKMDALKNKKKETEPNGDAKDEEAPVVEVIDVKNDTDDESSQSNRKKKKKSKKQKLEEGSEKENLIEAYSEEACEPRAEDVCENGGEEAVSVKSKKKKSKKQKLEEGSEKDNGFGTNSEEAYVTEARVEEVCENGGEEAVSVKSKKKKGKKQKLEDGSEKENGFGTNSEEARPEEVCENGGEEVVLVKSNKKKSKKQKLVEESEKENGFEMNSVEVCEPRSEEVCENGGEEAVSVKSKKKKSKKAPLSEQEPPCDEVIVVEDDETEEQASKKKKKKKSAREPTPEPLNETESPIDLTSQVDEADVSENPLKKKKSKKGAPEDTVGPEVEAPEPVSEELPQKKKKNKKRKAEEPAESLANDQSDIPAKKKKTKLSPEEEPSEEPETPSIEEPPTDITPLTSNNSTKSKKKNKPSSSSSTTATAKPVKVSSQHEISRLTDCHVDTYKISTFCAEKFRNVDLDSFHCSNISQLIGYGFSENLDLQIVSIEGDQDRITKLWSGTSNKYQQAVPKREIYQNYMLKAKQARREKKRIPKMKVKPLHRLSAFQSL